MRAPNTTAQLKSYSVHQISQFKLFVAISDVEIQVEIQFINCGVMHASTRDQIENPHR
jgi:hypothetical protein